MSSIARFHPSPAIVVASIALLIALGGTSVAAVSVLAPANSVGSTQVIDASLQKKDFKPGQIPRGPAGKAGPAGPSDAYSRSVAKVTLAATPVTLVSLSIPQAGKYVIWAKAWFTTSALDDAAHCTLAAGTDTDATWSYFMGGERVTVPSLVVHEFAAAGTVEFQCAASAKTRAEGIKVTAIRVANLTSAG